MSFCVKGGVYVAVADNVDDPDPTTITREVA